VAVEEGVAEVVRVVEAEEVEGLVLLVNLVKG
jgi:hypothetical protein